MQGDGVARAVRRAAIWWDQSFLLAHLRLVIPHRHLLVRDTFLHLQTEGPGGRGSAQKLQIRAYRPKATHRQPGFDLGCVSEVFPFLKGTITHSPCTCFTPLGWSPCDPGCHVSLPFPRPQEAGALLISVSRDD